MVYALTGPGHSEQESGRTVTCKFLSWALGREAASPITKGRGERKGRQHAADSHCSQYKIGAQTFKRSKEKFPSPSVTENQKKVLSTNLALRSRHFFICSARCTGENST